MDKLTNRYRPSNAETGNLAATTQTNQHPIRGISYTSYNVRFGLSGVKSWGDKYRRGINPTEGFGSVLPFYHHSIHPPECMHPEQQKKPQEPRLISTVADRQV